MQKERGHILSLYILNPHFQLATEFIRTFLPPRKVTKPFLPFCIKKGDAKSTLLPQIILLFLLSNL